MNKIEKLHTKIIEIEAEMLKLVKKLPKWNSNVGHDHGCSSIMYAFRANDIDDEDDFKLLIRSLICLECGGYYIAC